MKPGWWVLGGLALAAGAWLGGPAVGRRLDFFRVRRLELVGVQHLAPRTVIEALQLGPRSSVFDDLEAMQRRVAAVRGIEEAQVERRLPGALRVEVVEATPVALAPARTREGGALVMLDSAGRTLPFDPTRAAPDLPLASAPDSLVARLLARLKVFDPALYAQVAAARRQRDDVVLEVAGRRLLFTPDATAEEIRAVMAVAQDLARRGRSYAELDGRFAGQVIVRGGGGA